MKTPYQWHQETGHKTTTYSPDGIVKVEECPECGARFLHDPAFDYPITMGNILAKAYAKKEA